MGMFSSRRVTKAGAKAAHAAAKRNKNMIANAGSVDAVRGNPYAVRYYYKPAQQKQGQASGGRWPGKKAISKPATTGATTQAPLTQQKSQTEVVDKHGNPVTEPPAAPPEKNNAPTPPKNPPVMTSMGLTIKDPGGRNQDYRRAQGIGANADPRLLSAATMAKAGAELTPAQKWVLAQHEYKKTTGIDPRTGKGTWTGKSPDTRLTAEDGSRIGDKRNLHPMRGPGGTVHWYDPVRGNFVSPYTGDNRANAWDPAQLSPIGDYPVPSPGQHGESRAAVDRWLRERNNQSQTDPPGDSGGDPPADDQGENYVPEGYLDATSGPESSALYQRTLNSENDRPGSETSVKSQPKWDKFQGETAQRFENMSSQNEQIMQGQQWIFQLMQQLMPLIQLFQGGGQPSLGQQALQGQPSLGQQAFQAYSGNYQMPQYDYSSMWGWGQQPQQQVTYPGSNPFMFWS